MSAPIHRLVRAIAAVSVVLLLAAAGPAQANTTVTPTEQNFNVALKTGTSIAFLIPVTEVQCTSATSSSRTPPANRNNNPMGGVTMDFGRPVFTGCTSGAGWSIPVGQGPRAEAGIWSLVLFRTMRNRLGAEFGSPPVGIRMTVQRNGNANTCVINIPVGGSAIWGDNWVNGTAGTVSRFSSVNRVIAFLNPGAANACYTGDGGVLQQAFVEIAAHWEINDTTDTMRSITIA
jgi:hypothetical protein